MIGPTLTLVLLKLAFYKSCLFNFDFRLESYDRNFNFGHIQQREEEVGFQITTPTCKPTDYKDINTDSKVCIIYYKAHL